MQVILYLLPFAILKFSCGKPSPTAIGGDDVERKINLPKIETFVPTGWEGARLRVYPDPEVYHFSPCSNFSCETHHACIFGFQCRSPNSQSQKVCCLQDESLLHLWKCPTGEVSTLNKFCASNSDCGESGAECFKGWAGPLTKSTSDDSVDSTNSPIPGVCCAKQADVSPEILAECPTGFQLARNLPCGLSFPECDLSTQCMYSGDSFGRCCVSDKSSVRTDHKAFFNPGSSFPSIGDVGSLFGTFDPTHGSEAGTDSVGDFIGGTGDVPVRAESGIAERGSPNAGTRNSDIGTSAGTTGDTGAQDIHHRGYPRVFHFRPKHRRNPHFDSSPFLATYPREIRRWEIPGPGRWASPIRPIPGLVSRRCLLRMRQAYRRGIQRGYALATSGRAFNSNPNGRLIASTNLNSAVPRFVDRTGNRRSEVGSYRRSLRGHGVHKEKSRKDEEADSNDSESDEDFDDSNDDTSGTSDSDSDSE